MMRGDMTSRGTTHRGPKACRMLANAPIERTMAFLLILAVASTENRFVGAARPFRGLGFRRPPSIQSIWKKCRDIRSGAIIRSKERSRTANVEESRLELPSQPLGPSIGTPPSSHTSEVPDVENDDENDTNYHGSDGIPTENAAPAPPQDDPRILMLIRLLFMTYYGSLGSLLPYLPVYYHSLGHGGQIIGMLGAIKPFTTFLVAPFWGVVSDQTGSPFVVLYFTFLVSLIGQLMVAWKHDPTYIMVMVFITAFFNAPVKSLLDSMVMDHLHDRSRYGRLRLWGQLGFGIGSSGVGILLSKSKHRAHHPTPGVTILEKIDNIWQSLTGYRLLFLTYAILSVPTWFCIRAFHQMHDEKERQRKEQSAVVDGLKDAEKKAQENVSVVGELNFLLHNGDALLFFFLVFVVGVSSGMIENFAYVRIREVGGQGRAMGLSRLVSSLAGAPMFWFSGTLTELLGADRVIVLSLLSYVVRFVIYAFMRNPFQGLPAEAMRGITFAAFWSTCTVYASRIAPPGLGATMLMFLNAMYGGLGQSLGAIIGGKLQSKVGTVTTFLYAALFDLFFVSLVIVYLKMRNGQSSFKDPKPIVMKPKVKAKDSITVVSGTKAATMVLKRQPRRPRTRLLGLHAMLFFIAGLALAEPVLGQNIPQSKARVLPTNEWKKADGRVDGRVQVWDSQDVHPVWTRRLIAINIVAFVAQLMFPAVTPWGVQTPYSLKPRHVYRLVSSSFLHRSIAHLGCNMVALFNIGDFAETNFGPGRFLALYLISGICGSVLTLFASPVNSLGASGCFLGVLSGVFVFLTRNSWLFDDSSLKSLVSSIGTSLFVNVVILSQTSSINTWGHLGGAIGGAIFSILFGPRLYLTFLPSSGKKVIIDRPVLRLLCTKYSVGKMMRSVLRKSSVWLDKFVRWICELY